MAKAENKIQNAVLKHLLQQGIFAWRQGNHSIWDPKMNGYREHTGLKGVPDILSVINGQFVGWEIKTPRGKQSEHQFAFQKRLERNGGRYILVRSLDEAKEALASFF